MRGTGRFSLAYALVIGGPIAITPFAATWLRANGVGFELLGVTLAIPLVIRFFFFRILTRWAEKFSSPWLPILMLCCLSALLSLTGALSNNFALGLVAWWGVCVAAGACVPIFDAAILSEAPAQAGLQSLARAKSVSAFAYFLAVPTIGYCFGRLGPAGILLWSGSAALIACSVILFWLAPKSTFLSVWHSSPSVTHSVHQISSIPERDGDWPTLALAVCAATLIEASHGMQSVAMVGWQQRGFSPELNGFLWATGPLSDVVLLWLTTSIRSRLSPPRLLVIGASAAVVRWIGFTMNPSVSLVFVLQALHALSFTITSLASVQLAQALATKSKLGSQLMTWAISTGLAGGFAVVLATPLYGAIGTDGYWIMALLAGCGLIASIQLDRHWTSQRGTQFSAECPAIEQHLQAQATGIRCGV